MLSAFSIMGIVLNALSKEVNAVTTATNVDNIAIRERLGAYLERTGATKQSVASALGITTVTLASKLRGESLFDLEQAFRLADLMGCKVDDLRVRPFER
jgi:DNA-binding XRE family transcriptional regulator